MSDLGNILPMAPLIAPVTLGERSTTTLEGIERRGDIGFGLGLAFGRGCCLLCFLADLRSTGTHDSYLSLIHI